MGLAWFEIIKNGLEAFWTADWSAVQFKEGYFVEWIAAMLLVVLFLKLLWRWYRGRRSGYYEHSGYLINQQDQPSLSSKCLGGIVTLFLIGGVVFTLTAIADPYTILTFQTRLEQFQEIAYLRDTSTSMGWRYKNTNQARAEIVQDSFLKLLASRQGKKDRAFYLIFAWTPRLIASFTTDQQSLLFQAAVGPLVTTDADTPQNWPGRFIIKDFVPIPFEGGTDLENGLRAVVKIFDDQGDKKITEAIQKTPSLVRRSVIIITDGASETDPEPQLREIKKRHIVPYLVFIDPDREAEIQLHGQNSPQIKNVDGLLGQIRRYGGQSFLATDQVALEKIRQQLDQIYGLSTTVKTHTVEQHIYRLPLIMALSCLAIGLAARLIFWKSHQMV